MDAIIENIVIGIIIFGAVIWGIGYIICWFDELDAFDKLSRRISKIEGGSDSPEEAKEDASELVKDLVRYEFVKGQRKHW